MAHGVEQRASMRALVLLVLVGCTSTRQLASPVEPRLRAPIRGEGIIVATQTRWNARIDPNTRIRLRDAGGRWTDRLEGRELHVDGRGVWVDSGVLNIARYADEIELVGATPELLAAIERTRPPSAELQSDGETWHMLGGAASLRPWLEALETAVTPRGNERRIVEMCIDRLACSALPASEDPVRARYAAFDVPLAAIRIHTPQQGWRLPLRGTRLIDALRVGVTSKVGWPWDRVAAIEVQNISGGKTLAAIVGTMAFAVVVLPVAMVFRGVPGTRGVKPSSGAELAGRTSEVLLRAGQAEMPVHGAWRPELASTESVHAAPMFSTGAKVRSIIRPTLALETGGAKTGDLLGSGVIARLRFMDVFEIGGGVRLVGSRGDRGWQRSVTHVFAMGTHLALDAGRRFAVPLGFEASGGGAIAHDLRLPWGVRYTPRGGRWFGTVLPATPAWMRTTSEKHGRWTLNGSVELGVTF